MEKYEKTSLIACDIDELFDFHLDVSNISKITPSDTKVEVLTKDFKPSEGKILNIKSTKMFVPTFWSVEISLINKPSIIVDTAIKSPFSFWRHSHVFTKKGNMCELKDVVEYELPFGIFGCIFSGFIKKELENMFTYRHKQTKLILEKKD